VFDSGASQEPCALSLQHSSRLIDPSRGLAETLTSLDAAGEINANLSQDLLEAGLEAIARVQAADSLAETKADKHGAGDRSGPGGDSADGRLPLRPGPRGQSYRLVNATELLVHARPVQNAGEPEPSRSRSHSRSRSRSQSATFGGKLPLASGQAAREGPGSNGLMSVSVAPL
jgi:hypothetical protein